MSEEAVRELQSRFYILWTTIDFRDFIEKHHLRPRGGRKFLIAAISNWLERRIAWTLPIV